MLAFILFHEASYMEKEIYRAVSAFDVSLLIWELQFIVFLPY